MVIAPPVFAAGTGGTVGSIAWQRMGVNKVDYTGL
jgi:hypothetical protein